MSDRPLVRPRSLVWELTLRCDQACPHCGSDAGEAHPDELDTALALDAASQLGALGFKRATLIGGEAYMRPDLEQVVRALVQAGVVTTMQTGGRSLDEDRIASLKAAGLSGIGFSVDGTASVHDRQRGWRGSLSATFRAMDLAVAQGLPVSVNTQLNKLNLHELPAICSSIRDHRAFCWHLQLTVPTGRALRHPDWLLQPADLLPILDTLSELQLDAMARPRPWEASPFDLVAGDDLGYYGPHEETLRSRPGQGASYWQGCQAGCMTIGLRSDGTVLPCASMVTGAHDRGNVRYQRIADLWASDDFSFRRGEETRALWGFCASCYFARICQGGCSSTAHALLGRHGNNPYCAHRVATLQQRGVREVVEPVPDAKRGEAPFRIREEAW